MDFLDVGGVSILVAFAAGLLSVGSPCVLPLVPAYLGYLTGAALEGAAGATGVSVQSSGGGVAVAGRPPRLQVASPFLHSLSFVSGFTLVFVVFGISLGLVGYALKDNQDIILKVAGVMLIAMGLHLAGVITIPFMDQERRLEVDGGARVGYARSFVVGSAFSAGWSPCIGPTLASIFALAVSSSTALTAGVLLFAYSAGLSIPFLVMGLAYSSVQPFYNRVKRYTGVMYYLSGALLIIIGILIFTDTVSNLNSTFDFGLPSSNL
jgi:cytochrome c-type biogenesis protein